MKSIKFKLMWIIIFLLMSCGYTFRENIKSTDLDAGGKLKEGQAYIYGTYLYTVRTPTFFGSEPYLVLDIISKSESGGKEIYIPMNEDKGYIFTYLQPGEYTLVKIIFNMDGAVFNSAAVNKDFKVDANQIFYIADLKLEVLRTTQNYVWWGIQALDDNYQNGIDSLKQSFNSINTANFLNGYSSLAASIKPFEKKDVYEGGSRHPMRDMNALN